MNKKRIRKILSILCIGTMTVLLAVGPGSIKGRAASGAKVLYTVCDNEDSFRNTLSEAVVAAGNTYGVTVDMQLCGSEVETQVEQVAAAKAAGYDAVIVRLTDTSTALQMEVAADGLPIVFLNNEPDADRLSEGEYVYVGSDEEQAGQYQAEYVLKKLGNPTSMNVIIMEGEKGHSGTIGRTKAVKNTLKDAGVKANYVFVDYANWSSDEAYAKMQIFGKTGQSVDAVFCNNDTMALGVCDYLLDNGYTTDTIIPVTGVDATADGCTYISEGKMSFTVLQDASGQGGAAVQAAAALGSGESISSIDGASKDGKYIWIPFVPVDSSNVNDYMK